MSAIQNTSGHLGWHLWLSILSKEMLSSVQSIWYKPESEKVSWRNNTAYLGTTSRSYTGVSAVLGRVDKCYFWDNHFFSLSKDFFCYIWQYLTVDKAIIKYTKLKYFSYQGPLYSDWISHLLLLPCEMLPFFKADLPLYYCGNIIFIIGLYYLIIHVLLQVTCKDYLVCVLAVLWNCWSLMGNQVCVPSKAIIYNSSLTCVRLDLSSDFTHDFLNAICFHVYFNFFVLLGFPLQVQIFSRS